MTTTYQGRAGWQGRTITAILLAAVATVIGIVSAPAPAHAADQYIALAIGFVTSDPVKPRWPEARRSVPAENRP